MSEEVPPNPPPAIPPLVLPPLPRPVDAKKSGCLTWGLVGCAAGSVIVIVGLVFLMSNARQMMGWALTKVEDAVLMGCTADVTPAEKTEFREAFARFRTAATESKATPDQVKEIQEKATAAAADGKVTPEELRALTATLKKAAP
jgi:hypothetical protein